MEPAQTFKNPLYRWVYQALFVAVSAAVFCFLFSIAFQHDHLRVCWRSVLVASALYLLAHCLRAIRLAVVATSLTKLSGRFTLLLHFATAPLVMCFPFKMGELARLGAFCLAGVRLFDVVMIVLLDRLFDAVMLGVLLVTTGTGYDSAASGEVIVQWMIMGVALAAGLGFLVAPRTLVSLQRYILLNHSTRGTLRELWLVDLFRRGTTKGQLLLRNQGMMLLMVSAMIWILELAATSLFMPLASPNRFQDVTALLMAHLNWGGLAAFSSPIDPALAASAASSLIALLVVWPIALYGFCKTILTGQRVMRQPAHKR